jgi:hypothetical protein
MSLPEKSDDPTLAVLVWRHHDQTKVSKGWTREDFNRLCKLANLLPEELGALCAVKPGAIHTMIKNDKFPPTVSLHLSNIREIVIEAQCKKMPEIMMPIHLFAERIMEVKA